MSRQSLWIFGVRQVALAVLLAYSHAQGLWTLDSVGIRQEKPWVESILAGELGFLAVILANIVALLLTRRLKQMRLVAVRGNLRAWPRGRAQKWFAAFFIMVCNPFTEELVMRGILIHQWGLLLGSPAIPIAVGFVLNGALHWYQGWRMQPWHALYFCMAVSLLYSPWGLLAAITAHVFGDVMPFLFLERQLRRAHAARRAARTQSP